MTTAFNYALEKLQRLSPILPPFRRILHAVLCKSHHVPDCKHLIAFGSFLYGDHSIAPLRITRKMLVRLLSYYQVMPSYLEFLLLFGIHRHSREKRFSAFRSEILLGGQNLSLDVLGRRGCHFELCYNLKTVARWTENGQLVPTDGHWSIRQGAFYHKFDIWKGKAVWIITRAGLDIKERIESLTGKIGRSEDRGFQTPAQCLKSSLAVHLLLCHWSQENWRMYFQYLEDMVETQVRISDYKFLH